MSVYFMIYIIDLICTNLCMTLSMDLYSLIGKRLSFSSRAFHSKIKLFHGEFHSSNRTVRRIHKSEIRSRLPGRAPRALEGAQEIRYFFNS